MLSTIRTPIIYMDFVTSVDIMLKQKLAFQDFFERIKSHLNDLIKRFIEPMKNAFKFMTSSFAPLNRIKLNITRISRKIGWRKLHLVVDANCVISNVIGFVKYGISTLLNLFSNPFFVGYAPPKLIVETEKNLIKIAEEDKLDKEKVLLALRIHFLSKLSILEADYIDIEHAKRELKNNTKDVDYLALYFSVDADGVLTNDNRFLKPSDPRRWESDGASKIVVELNPFGKLFETQKIFLQMVEYQRAVLDNFMKAIKIFVPLRISSFS